MVAMVAITVQVRKRVREENKIRARGPLASCPFVEDCCCGVFCTHCTQCMLLRQAISKGMLVHRYNLGSTFYQRGMHMAPRETEPV